MTNCYSQRSHPKENHDFHHLFRQIIIGPSDSADSSFEKLEEPNTQKIDFF
jgi:hypothetical protein